MAKKGGKKHVKRIAALPIIPIHDRKASTWLLKPMPGAHKAGASLPLVVLIRDVLGFALDAREAKKIIAGRMVEVDGKVRTEPKYAVGMNDVVSFQRAEKFYRMLVDSRGKLVPVSIPKDEVGKKICKVVGKYTYNKKIMLRLHDGKNVHSDGTAFVGDSVVITLPENNITQVLKLEKGARCFVTEGRHVGTIAKLEELIRLKGGRKTQARLSSPSGEFVTVVDYLLVVDDGFKGVS